MVKVSVIIPCYNQGSTLDETVASVLQQTYDDFEIIIINDGSTDQETNTLLAEYDKPRTRVITTSNQGLAAARNNGISAATGTYILPLDADDTIAPEYMEKAVPFLDNNPDIGIVYSRARFFGAEEHEWPLPEFTIENMLFDNIIFCSAFFRRQDWESVGGYDQGMIYGWEDYEFWLSLIEKGRQVFRIPEILFHYRVASDSMVRTKSPEQRLEMFARIYRRHQQFFSDNIEVWLQTIQEIKSPYLGSKLYLDMGLGFNEQQTIKRTVNPQTSKLEFDLSSRHGIRNVQVNLLNEYCVVDLKRIVLKGPEGEETVSEFTTNMVKVGENQYIAVAKPPHIFIPILEKDIDWLVIELDYIAMGEDIVRLFAEFAYKPLLADREGLVQQKNGLEQQLEQQQLQLEQQREEQQLQLKQHQLQMEEQQLQMEQQRRQGIENRVIRQEFNAQFVADREQARFIQYSGATKKRQQGIKGYLHWLYMQAHILRCSFTREYALVKNSGLFDATYYTYVNPDINVFDLNPLAHFLMFGEAEGRRPNALFDPDWYLAQENVPQGETKPLLHYLETGGREADPSPVFNTDYYLGRNKDLDGDALTPLGHYLSRSNSERISPHPFFDQEYYCSTYPNVDKSPLDPLSNFLLFGSSGQRNPNPFFNAHYYLLNHPGCLARGENPLVHFLSNRKTSFGASYPHPVLEADAGDDLPLISIVTPVYNIDRAFLQKCVDSVRYQTYGNWELCLVDDCSPSDHVRPLLQEYADLDPRIKVAFLDKNLGISGASNHGASMATGDWIGFLDHDDELSCDALMVIALTILLEQPDVIYSDENLIDIQGREQAVHHKPDFSPDLLFSHNYITHLMISRKALFDRVGGFSRQCSGAQDYDLILRLTEQTKRIVHIPQVLYHWRIVEGSTAENPESKRYADTAGKLALERAMERRKIQGDVLATDKLFFYRVRRKLRSEPLVSIIIPFKDQPKLLRQCMETILQKSVYQNYEILGIDNNSCQEETEAIKEGLMRDDRRIRFLDYGEPFNYSRINNFAVEHAKGSHLVFMNNDIKVITPEWIESLLEHSQREQVGAVGGKLYYADETIQHAGLIIGIGGSAGHAHKRFPAHSPGYFNRLLCVQNVSAVTGALLMIKTDVFKEVDGFDEENLPIAFNDVDLCLKILAKGYLNVFTPYCEAWHYESISRGYEDTEEKQSRFAGERAFFRSRWQKFLQQGDPYYNPNLTLDREDFSVKSD